MTVETTHSPKIRPALMESSSINIANQCQFNVQNSAKVMVAMPGSYVLHAIQTETYIDKGCDSLRQNPVIHDLDPGRSQAHRLGVLHSFSHPAVDIWLGLLQA